MNKPQTTAALCQRSILCSGPIAASAYILNESAIKRMGFTPESAIGKKIRFQDVDGYVVGVVKDFHFKAMTVAIEPMVLHNWRLPWATSLLIKARGNRINEAIAVIEKTYKKHESQTAPSYQFLDQALENQYRLEQNTGKIVLFFSALAIIVSCLGLLVWQHTQQSKEPKRSVFEKFWGQAWQVLSICFL